MNKAFKWKIGAEGEIDRFQSVEKERFNLIFQCLNKGFYWIYYEDETGNYKRVYWE